MTTTSIFADAAAQSWPYRYAATVNIGVLMAGTPADPNKAEAWLRTKIEDTDDAIRRAVAETVADTGLTADEALKRVNELKNLCVFKRDEHGLFIEGRQVKAALKEAASIAAAADKINLKWGKTHKYIVNWLAEHVFVEEERLYLARTEADDVLQQFIHSFRGSSIQYNEYVKDVEVSFTVVTDHEFSENDWAMLWTTGEKQGLGSCRSQGYGTYVVTKWEKAKPRRGRKAA